MKHFSILAALLVLAACGSRQMLKPQTGQSLPPTPAAAAVAPTAAQLITPTNQSRPQRTDELITRSQKRQSDPFDLPPPG